MALSVKVGSFAQPTSTNATFGVIGVGFQPLAIILFATDRTSSGTSANIAHYMGMATSSSNRGAISSVGTSSTTKGSRSADGTKVFIVYS
ncbi:MAG: hypothetical protein ACREQ5_23675, partial [Candidatus Dormibacteria bacterium]